MARKATGSAYEQDGRFYALVSVKGAGGRSRRIPKRCPPKVKSLDQARAWSAWLAEQLALGKLVLDEPASPASEPAKPETFRQWCERWLQAREARHLASVKDDASRLRTHIWPAIGDIPMTSVTTADLERLVAALDARIHAATLSWRTARNIWAVVTKAFDDARKSKDLSLRVRQDNPATDVAPPDEGVTKAKVYLYPSEVMAVFHQADVPVRWKRLVALSVYLYVRAGELEALEWEDLDLARGIIHVHRSVDRYRDVGKVKSTKSSAGRRFQVEAEILPLLRVMRDEAGGTEARGRVVKMPPAEDLAERLRQYLEWAQVKRAELHTPVSDPTRKRITWHDLRATGITWRAVRGDDPIKIQASAGHANFGTTQIYIREAEALASAFGTVFPPLPESVLRPDEASRRSV